MRWLARAGFGLQQVNGSPVGSFDKMRIFTPVTGIQEDQGKGTFDQSFPVS
jgi:hypothetical protein